VLSRKQCSRRRARRSRSTPHAFYRLVGSQALRIGELGADWEEGFRATLRATPFLTW
jgi:hypothetical protein